MFPLNLLFYIVHFYACLQKNSKPTTVQEIKDVLKSE